MVDLETLPHTEVRPVTASRTVVGGDNSLPRSTVTAHPTVPPLGSSLTKVTGRDREAFQGVMSMPTMLCTRCHHKRLNKAAEDTSPKFKVSKLLIWGVVLVDDVAIDY